MKVRHSVHTLQTPVEVTDSELQSAMFLLTKPKRNHKKPNSWFKLTVDVSSATCGSWFQDRTVHQCLKLLPVVNCAAKQTTYMWGTKHTLVLVLAVPGAILPVHISMHNVSLHAEAELLTYTAHPQVRRRETNNSLLQSVSETLPQCSSDVFALAADLWEGGYHVPSEHL